MRFHFFNSVVIANLKMDYSKYFISLNNIVTKTYCDVTILIIHSGNERAKKGYFVCNTNYKAIYAGCSLGIGDRRILH